VSHPLPMRNCGDLSGIVVKGVIPVEGMWWCFNYT